MTDPVSSIRHLGPAYEASLAAVGITSAQALRAIGPDAAYAKLLANGQRPHFIAYYALVMALQGRPWNDCKGAEKDKLRVTFDLLKKRNENTDAHFWEATLDAIGTGKRR
ncbi:TfoX/Sxy family DNA transformation protein [Litoreibacter albidus]|uniref:TfoX C-terminal domain-containing protein n=1 Tax=Litoreibacter albidus TaxID=670155 RepID=A0A1H2XM58_9RHOB|nr:TfoX/Sxy family DNA transformation protein [Litoreibacter albidus]SDW93880.1 TfoX C-terminal domain-containing protein [Litoreibacter albidus]